MKNFKVTVTEKESGKLVFETTELSNTIKYLRNKYTAKYRFQKPECAVKVKRMIRPAGEQLDLLIAIKEIEQQENQD